MPRRCELKDALICPRTANAMELPSPSPGQYWKPIRSKGQKEAAVLFGSINIMSSRPVANAIHSKCK